MIFRIIVDITISKDDGIWIRYCTTRSFLLIALSRCGKATPLLVPPQEPRAKKYKHVEVETLFAISS
jgi:hypothetical protein